MIRSRWWLGAAAYLGLVAGSWADEPVTGASVFAGRCAVCHGGEGAGIPGSFPSLHEQIVEFAKLPAGRDYLVMVVTTGLMGQVTVGSSVYNGVMPAQSGLSDAEVAAVLSYLAGGMGKTVATTSAFGPTDIIEARSRHPERTAQATRALRPSVPLP